MSSSGPAAREPKHPEPTPREPASREPTSHEPTPREPKPPEPTPREPVSREPKHPEPTPPAPTPPEPTPRRPVVTDRRPTGLLRWALRMPIWLYRAHLGRLLGHRMVYVAHRGRRSGARREVVIEAVRYDREIPEITVIAAWGGRPDWYRNLRAAPAIEVRSGADRWPAPQQHFPDTRETLDVLRAYQSAHPAAFRQLGPRLGFPGDPADPTWPEVAARVHAIAFRPASAPPFRR